MYSSCSSSTLARVAPGKTVGMGHPEWTMVMVSVGPTLGVQFLGVGVGWEGQEVERSGFFCVEK